MKIKLLAWLGGWILKPLLASYRFVEINPEVVRECEKSGILFAFWHRNILSFVGFYRKRPITTMASQSKDGEIISRILEGMGYRMVRGSSSKGGSGALKALASLLRQGFVGAMTVDGPRGPAHIPKAGTLLLGKLSGHKIIPFSCHPERSWVFHKSWDKFRLPRPFTKINVHYGPPLVVPRDLPKEGLEGLIDSLALALHEGEKCASQEQKKNN